MIESNHRKSKSVALKIFQMDRVKKFDVGDLPFDQCYQVTFSVVDSIIAR